MTKPLGSISEEAKYVHKLLQSENSNFVDIDNMVALRQSIDIESKAASEKAIDDFSCQISYLEIGGIKTLKIEPEKAINNRQIMYLFGGGFTTGSPLNDLVISAQMADYTKSIIYCPYYRLAPEFPFPAALEDIFEFAKTLWAKSLYPPLLMGESAGATLALSLTHLLKKHNLKMPKKMGLLSPACDLHNEGDSFVYNDKRDPILNLENVTAVSDIYAGGNKYDNPLLSPIYGQFDKTYPKTLITSGTRDLLLSSCIRLSKVMRGANVNVELRVWEGMWHVFEYYPDIPESKQSLKEMALFFEDAF